MTITFRLVAVFTVFFIACIVTSKCSVSQDCGSEMATNVYINITGCPPTMNPCVIHKDGNISVSVTFTSKEVATKVTQSVHGIIGGFPVPFPIPQPDACASKALPCPLKANTKYVFKSQIPVKSAYPSITLTVKWELKDQNGKDLACLEVPAKIESKAQTALRLSHKVNKPTDSEFNVAEMDQFMTWLDEQAS